MFGKQAYIALGDSHTRNFDYGLKAKDFYPSIVGERLGLAPASFAVPGNTSTEVARLLHGSAGGVLRIADVGLVTIYLGQNDLPAASKIEEADLDHVRIQGGRGHLFGHESRFAPFGRMRRGQRFLRFRGVGWVSVGGRPTQVKDVTGDVLTFASPLTERRSAGELVIPDTETNLNFMLAILRDRYPAARVVVIGQHTMNISSNGETATIERSDLSTLRAAQRLAAAKAGVPFVDLHEIMRARFVAGLDIAGHHSWHVADNNSHLNKYGEQIIADAVIAALN